MHWCHADDGKTKINGGLMTSRGPAAKTSAVPLA